MPFRSPEVLESIATAIMTPSRWEMYYEPDPFAFILRNVIGAMMMRKAAREKALDDFMELMMRVGPDVVANYLEFEPFKEYVQRATGLKPKDIERFFQLVASWMPELPSPFAPPTPSQPESVPQITVPPDISSGLFGARRGRSLIPPVSLTGLVPPRGSVDTDIIGDVIASIWGIPRTATWAHRILRDIVMW